MAKNTSVTLGREHERFVRTQLRTGGFGSASEAVRAGLQLLETQELKTERLRKSLRDGEESGEPQVFDMENFIAAKRMTG